MQAMPQAMFPLSAAHFEFNRQLQTNSAGDREKGRHGRAGLLHVTAVFGEAVLSWVNCSCGIVID